MEKVHPHCRYHPETALERQDELWTLQQVTPAPDSVKRMGRETMATGTQFAASLYRCPRCGYAEMFDDDAAAI